MTITLKRVNNLLFFFIVLTVVLYFGRPLLVPFIFACLLAMLMAPVCRKLDSLKFPRALSCLVSILILLVVMVGIVLMVSNQIASFSQQWPAIEQKLNMMIEKVQVFIQHDFDISKEEQNTYIDEKMKSAGDSMGNYFGAVLGGVIGVFGNISIILIMTYLMLYNKEMYETFFIKLYKSEHINEMKKMMADITLVSQQYLTGRAISMAWQMTAFSVGLLIIGIENAILLGIIAGLMSLVPYLGPYLGGIFPVLMSLVTSEKPETTLWVIGLLVTVQFIDNTFVEPNVVGGKVKLSALATIIIILIGGLLWGVVGMILFIPMLGIAKIIFDHFTELKPYAYLIGDPDESNPSKVKDRINNFISKFKKGAASAETKNE